MAALQNRFQHVSEESLTIENGELPTEFMFNGARFHRTKSQGPQLRLAYCATVALSPEVEQNLTLAVRTLAELPAEALIYLFPSRYCQSDSMLHFARSEFWADHLTGFELVTRLCNWIYQRWVTGVARPPPSPRRLTPSLSGRAFAATLPTWALPCVGRSAYRRASSGPTLTGLTPPDFHAVFEA